MKGFWKRISSLAGLSTTAGAWPLVGPQWWVVVLTIGLAVLTVVIAVCWLATRPNSGRVSSPLLRWECNTHSDDPALGVGDANEADLNQPDR